MAIEQLRPVFHITGGNGWINDPNGLVKFNGEYHVFYQYYAEATYWGPMHWGHVKSKDLTHWERLPVAIRPDEQDDGCFSGSAIVHNGKLWLLYTSYKKNDGGVSERQLQALASSDDGIHFFKHGIVIGEDDLPEGYCPWSFRDPKVLRVNGVFYCFVAAKLREGTGRILLYKSTDLFRWEFVCAVTGESGGKMIECPDYCTQLGLLTYSEQFQPHEGKTHLNIHSSFAHFGFTDFEKPFVPDSKRQIIDYGFDFYASQTFADEPIMIGWLGMWDRNYPCAKYGFAGMLTVPRRLRRQGDELLQTPVYAAEKVCEKAVNGRLTDSISVGAIRLDIKDLRAFDLKMRKSDDGFARFTLSDSEWIFDRSRAGARIVGVEEDDDSLAGIRRMPYRSAETVTVEIVFDLFSAEIFVNGKALSATLYPEPSADGLDLEIDCSSCTYSRYEIAKS